MILRSFTRAEAEEKIRASSPKWPERAARANAEAKKTGTVGSTFWSEAKPALLSLQQGNCVFCDQGLPWNPQDPLATVGKGVSDVEHYRPKGRTTAWPVAKDLEGRPIPYASTLRHGRRTGYAELAHEVENLSVSCKACNSDCKNDRFPIEGPAGRRGKAVADLNASEKPLLLFPVGPYADDPEEHLRFEALTVVPTRRRGASRGRVTIDFFRLDDRHDLRRGRALAIFQAVALIERKRGVARRRAIEEVSSGKLPFAASIRAYFALASESASKAATFLEACERIALGSDPWLGETLRNKPR